jgi:hypothetical protein
MGVANFGWKRMKNIQKDHRMLFALELAKHPSRSQLETLAEKEALVIIRPVSFSEN